MKSWKFSWDTTGREISGNCSMSSTFLQFWGERCNYKRRFCPLTVFECPRPISACAPALHMDEIIALLVLSAIWEINLKGDIAGRGSILRFLKRTASPCFEYKIRKRYFNPAFQNLIANHQGKYGLTLTEKGVFACLYQISTAIKISSKAKFHPKSIPYKSCIYISVSEKV